MDAECMAERQTQDLQKKQVRFDYSPFFRTSLYTSLCSTMTPPPHTHTHIHTRPFPSLRAKVHGDLHKTFGSRWTTDLNASPDFVSNFLPETPQWRLYAATLAVLDINTYTYITLKTWGQQLLLKDVYLLGAVHSVPLNIQLAMSKVGWRMRPVVY